MTDRELLLLARNTLTLEEFSVWFAKHYAGNGRRSGSLALGITEDQWRYRLARATLKITVAIENTEAA